MPDKTPQSFLLVGDLRTPVLIKVDASSQDEAIDKAKSGDYEVVQHFQEGEQDFEWSGVFLSSSESIHVGESIEQGELPLE